jgi:hypothetical protein
MCHFSFYLFSLLSLWFLEMVDHPGKWLTHASFAGRLGIDSLPKLYEMFSAVFQKKFIIWHLKRSHGHFLPHPSNSSFTVIRSSKPARLLIREVRDLWRRVGMSLDLFVNIPFRALFRCIRTPVERLSISLCPLFCRPETALWNCFLRVLACTIAKQRMRRWRHNSVYGSREMCFCDSRWRNTTVWRMFQLVARQQAAGEWTA